MNRGVSMKVKDLFRQTFYDEQDSAYEDLALAEISDIIQICQTIEEIANQKKKEMLEATKDIPEPKESGSRY